MLLGCGLLLATWIELRALNRLARRMVRLFRRRLEAQRIASAPGERALSADAQAEIMRQVHEALDRAVDEGVGLLFVSAAANTNVKPASEEEPRSRSALSRRAAERDPSEDEPPPNSGMR